MRWLIFAATVAAGCASEPPSPIAGPPEPRQPKPAQVWDPPPAPAGVRDARAASALRQFVALMLEQYREHCTCYPSTQEGLAALFARPEGNERWRGPYVDGRPPVVDPWGREFLYRSDRLTYELVSAGEDGTFGTADDIGGKKP